jgi:hypothetical protein
MSKAKAGKRHRGSVMDESEKEKKEMLAKELKDLCKPLNEWLKKNFDSHAKIIIEVSGAEITQGFLGVSLEVKE